MSEYMIEMEGISKRFGTVQANSDVSLHIRPGEIRALLGENGAGKSTLMKILYGLYTSDCGRITVAGQEMPRKFTPQDAIDRGIAMVSQHFMLVDAFTVAENIILGREQDLHKVLFSREKAERRVQQLCEQYGIDLSAKSPVGTLSMGEKQKTEILKALYRNNKVLILDEPTSVLTPQETQDLFRMLRDMRASGMTVILISHKLEDVMEIADNITIMRQGEKICTLRREDTNIQELASLMVGRKLQTIAIEERPIADGEEPLFSLRDIHTNQIGERCSLKGLDLDLYRGKIVGVAGVDGNGQTELLEVLAGFRQIQSGTITCGGKVLHQNSVREMQRFKIGIIPEDRHGQGLVLELSTSSNLLLRRRKDKAFSWKGILKNRAVDSYADEMIREFDIRPTQKELEVRTLSGGNQQKVVIARELGCPGLEIVVAAQPTRGLDIGAIEFVHGTLTKLRDEGKAVLLISSDLDEIRTLSDYIAVLYDGRVMVNELSSKLTTDAIGMAMGGAQQQEVSV